MRSVSRAHPIARIDQLVLKNPFHYDFPRQPVTWSLPPDLAGAGGGLLLTQLRPSRQRGIVQPGPEGLTFFTDLPQRTDRVFALYQATETPARLETPQHHGVSPEDDGRTGVILTGAAAFRIPWGDGADGAAAADRRAAGRGAWRGRGRLILPAGVSVVSRHTRVLAAGPLYLTARIDYLLSDQTHYTWELTAHRDEPYLLVREIPLDWTARASSFPCANSRVGRGYLHWKAEGGDRHWSEFDGRRPRSRPAAGISRVVAAAAGLRLRW